MVCKGRGKRSGCRCRRRRCMSRKGNKGELVFSILRVLLPLYTNDAQSFHPPVTKIMSEDKHVIEKKDTHASARSRDSFTTPVTPLIMSRLSVASIKMCCAARVTALAVGRRPLRCVVIGDDARLDAGVPDKDRSGPPALRSLRCRTARPRRAAPADAPAAELAPGAPSGIP